MRAMSSKESAQELVDQMLPGKSGDVWFNVKGGQNDNFMSKILFKISVTIMP